MEVDPEMINIGNDFFDLKNYDIKTIIGDARVTMKNSTEKYDVIFGDAYNSFISVPWYLLTEEWNNEIKERLNDGGIYAINFIGSVSGDNSSFTNSVLDTFKISFPNYYIFAFGETPEETQSIVLVGVKGNLPISEAELYGKLSTGENNFLAKIMLPATSLPNTSSIVLTDNFAPVEKLMEPTIKSYFPQNLFYFKNILSL